MKTIVATDIHGITPELRALLAPLGNSVQFLSPWGSDQCPYKSEQEAVTEFIANNGIETYAKTISDAAGSAPAFVIGFSVGATSAWLHATHASCNPKSIVHLIYGSRIRDHLGRTPKCDVSAIFAEHEASFMPSELIEKLRVIGVQAEIICGTSHGFMNPNHPKYDPIHSAAQINRLLTLRPQVLTGG